jgi:hypothetical protein
MNEERFRELARQAGVLIDWGEDIKVGRWGIGGKYENMQKFAELIVRECAKVAWYHTPDTEELEYSHLIEDKILKHFGVEE